MATTLRCWRLPLQFDAAALQADLQALDREPWPAHFNSGYHDGGWSGVALVAPGGDPTQLYAGIDGEGTVLPTPLLARCAAIAAVLAALPGQAQSVRLLRLAPGAVVREHRDHGLGPGDGLVRLHVPIRTNPGVEFYLDGERVPMAAGECWTLDFSRPHRVQNLGDGERVHLVVDCRPDARFHAWQPTPEASEAQLRALQARAGETAAARLAAFRRRLLHDAPTLDALQAIGDAAGFARRLVALGAAAGVVFTDEDVRAELRAGRAELSSRRVV